MKITTCLLLTAVCLGLLFMTGIASIATAAPVATPDTTYKIGGIENPEEFERAFVMLQAALTASDRGAVVDFVLLPLRVNGWNDESRGKITREFGSRQAVLENFPAIFTPKVQAAIQQQKLADLFINCQGVMVGNGEAWLTSAGKNPVRYGVFAVNLGM